MVEPASKQGKAILVATDLTDLQILAKEAIDQAQGRDATAWLLHVIPAECYDDSGSSPSFAAEQGARDAERVLAKTALELCKRHLPCQYEVRRSVIIEAIPAFVREKQISQLIQGTSAKGRFGRFFLGSVAETMIHSLDIPICTIGRNNGRVQASGLSPILVATSLVCIAESRAQLTLAATLAEEMKAQIALLHVMPSNEPDTAAPSAERAIAQMSEIASEVRSQCHIFVRFGNPIEEFQREFDELSPRALVLGAKDSKSQACTVRSGIVHQMIASAPCPVFTLRDGQQPAPVRGFSENHEKNDLPC